ncbi:hypothetical protein Micbo1qcDRAFT_55221 [Microdochium bolleyi]|uniref:Uncharacterized protein n=1 Tax=Microdochium bolleyi TaxID=196109 RepID=A0A136J8F4_9PEZI|nr:hypothetical protein Micbo1qcDRAFT_55221 [Microdochium bolleyi]
MSFSFCLRPVATTSSWPCRCALLRLADGWLCSLLASFHRFFFQPRHLPTTTTNMSIRCLVAGTAIAILYGCFMTKQRCRLAIISRCIYALWDSCVPERCSCILFGNNIVLYFPWLPATQNQMKWGRAQAAWVTGY